MNEVISSFEKELCDENLPELITNQHYDMIQEREVRWLKNLTLKRLSKTLQLNEKRPGIMIDQNSYHWRFSKV